MAIAGVKKILIISHQSQSEKLLADIHKQAIVHLVDIDSSTIVAADTELKVAAVRDRDAEETIQKLEKTLFFLKKYYKGDPLSSLLAPKAVVDAQTFDQKASDKTVLKSLDRAVKLQDKFEHTNSEIEAKKAKIVSLEPWKSLEDNLEDLGSLSSVDVFTGSVSVLAWDQLEQALQQEQTGAVVNVVNRSKTQIYCVIVAPKQSASDIYKLLRSNEFESASLEGLRGTVEENIESLKDDVRMLEAKLKDLQQKAVELAGSLLDFQILYDAFVNRRSRSEAHNGSAATERTRIFEGWVKSRDMDGLKDLASKYDGVSIYQVQPDPDEQVPVEIVNNPWAKPFEVITKLYGAPKYFEVDPTAVLAPFFAIFFALCLTDAGYGLVMIAASVFLLRKIQVGKNFVMLLLICSVLTIFAGAMTGGWFGSTVLDFAQRFNIGWLESFIVSTTWFNPLEEPMTFLVLSIILGYIQIMTGLIVGFWSIFKNNGLFAAVCDKLSWLVLLNSIIVMAAAKAGYLAQAAGTVAIVLIIAAAATILLLSHREGGIGPRLGMGSYNLFSAIFYLGDLLSYLRLMALGMATGGVAMAVNIIAGLIGDTPYIGGVLMVLFLILGHTFNILQSLLGAFVHSMRLQFVEFFPKFMEGGGKEFTAFGESYKYIHIKD